MGESSGSVSIDIERISLGGKVGALVRQLDLVVHFCAGPVFFSSLF